jgi:FtsH-binding integral membrane protein
MQSKGFPSMNDLNRGYARSIPADRADMSVDAGLRSFMLGVYNKVALGLLLSAALAFLTSSYPPVRDLMFQVSGNRVGYTLLGTIVAFAPLAILLFSGFVMKSITARTAGVIYWTIVSLIGASMGTVVLLYTGASVFQTFLVTAIAFGGLSLVGYTTKKDLTGFGSFLIVGLVGLILASLVSVFFPSGPLVFAINAIGVLIFAGLIAYDTQKLKMTYYEVGGDETARSIATNYGALNLYLDFINLFRFLLYFMGSRR